MSITKKSSTMILIHLFIQGVSKISLPKFVNYILKKNAKNSNGYNS